MIDENKLINYIKTKINPYGRPFEGTVFEFGCKVMEHIENMDKVGEWISVEERLPEGCDDAEIEVLISTKEEYPDALFEEAGFALYYPGTKKFHSVYGDRLDITEIVTAWQHLPAPYDMRKKVEE